MEAEMFKEYLSLQSSFLAFIHPCIHSTQTYCLSQSRSRDADKEMKRLSRWASYVARETTHKPVFSVYTPCPVLITYVPDTLATQWENWSILQGREVVELWFGKQEGAQKAVQRGCTESHAEGWVPRGESVWRTIKDKGFQAHQRSVGLPVSGAWECKCVCYCSPLHFSAEVTNLCPSDCFWPWICYVWPIPCLNLWTKFKHGRIHKNLHFKRLLKQYLFFFFFLAKLEQYVYLKIVCWGHAGIPRFLKPPFQFHYNSQ